MAALQATLQASRLPLAPLHVKMRTAFLTLAISDALGGPAEFRRRGTFPKITSFISNNGFGLPPGSFTDDTSMALCLATSISADPAAFSLKHQASLYLKWWRTGYMSSSDCCFDIGATTASALRVWEHIEKENHTDTEDETVLALKQLLNKERSCGNGSLMRILPVGLMYWRSGKKRAIELAERSSSVTHPHIRCSEACGVYTHLVCSILEQVDSELNPNKSTLSPPSTTTTSSTSSESYSKLDLLRELSSYPFTDPMLKATFNFKPRRSSSPFKGRRGSSDNDVSAHPLLYKTEDEISSSGYVLHTLEAALWCFFTTDTFEDGVIKAVNLADDADTVAAVYGGLAGLWYVDSPMGTGKFWSPQVMEYVDGLQKKEIVENVAKELVTAHERFYGKTT